MMTIRTQDTTPPAALKQLKDDEAIGPISCPHVR